MYIQKAEITNIKSIEKFEIEFKNPAGWHVLIGDNGSGKTTIVRAIALALVGGYAGYLRENWNSWIRTGKLAIVKLNSYRNPEFDQCLHRATAPSKLGRLPNFQTLNNPAEDKLTSIIHEFWINSDRISTRNLFNTTEEVYYAWLPQSGFFSSAFGPYRRFEGGSSEWDEVYENQALANLASHLSVFDESVALTEPIKWLKDLNYKTLEKNKKSEYTLENLKKLINSEDFLPHNSKLEKISSDGVFFKDGNGSTIAVNQMSDGYRSILSLTFELIRQLVRVYGSEKVFKNIEKGEMFIDLPGVVLIDEIDAHLHPTWQTRIGQWFLKYFPQLQFIVTTHSPLVCRACEKGSIWRLAAPGSDEKSGEVTGIDRDRLIYGNILDAYGTEVFGTNIAISKASVEKQEELVKLGKKKMAGVINKSEETKLNELRKTFTTDDPIDL